MEGGVAGYAEGVNSLSWRVGSRIVGSLCLAQTRVSEYICPERGKRYARRMGGGPYGQV